VLPLPEVWNAVGQLVARGPGVKVAALPVVAKVGCGAVAVGLTAGAVVAVDHEVERQPANHAAGAHAAAPAPQSGTSAAGQLRHDESSTGRASESAVVARFVSVRLHASTVSHSPARHAPAKKTSRPAHESEAAKAAPAASSRSEPENVSSSHVARQSASPPGHSNSSHASSRGNGSQPRGNGKAWGKTAPAKTSGNAKVPPGQSRSAAARPKTVPSGKPPQSGAASAGNGHVQAAADASTPPVTAAGQDNEHPEHPDHPAHPDQSAKP